MKPVLQALPTITAAVLAMLLVSALLAVLLRRLRGEDRIAHLEAALCRERSARPEADRALAEAGDLLARLAARAAGDCAGDPAGQLVAIQAELAQIQQRCGADQAIRARLELLRRRLDRLGDSLRTGPRAAQPG